MKKFALISCISLLLFAAAASHLHAQQQRDGRVYMHYIVEDGDTVYVDVITPAWIFPKGSKIDRTEWRKYTKLVYNFNKVYPYALLGKRLLLEVDTTIDEQNLKRGKKDKYINKMQWQLLRDFESDIRHMTISQGQLLVRLVDRELGRTSYDIVKIYKSGAAAGFWQGIAKLFGQNLKNHYDPDGVDKQTEELVRKWERGEFDDFYFSIFWEWPKKTVLPSKYQ